MHQHYLAIDLGAESGRLMLGTLTEGRLSLDELHRFPNTPLTAEGSLHWNVDALFSEVGEGLRRAGALGLPFASISTDSWGLDYVLVDAHGRIIPPTFHYRNPRTGRGVERMHALVPWPDIFAETGIQFMPMNTIYQLAAEAPERWQQAKQFLPIADAINWHLCGVARAEESLASTTQLYNPRTRNWSPRLLQALQLPRELFPPIVASGTPLGPLHAELARAAGVNEMPVIATCSHDTGAAVAAIPASGEDWAYLSSGTWSLMGAELTAPLHTEPCREFNFTNEIGFGGTVRLLKNIVGLWIVQECRRAWAQEDREFDYATLMQLAAAAPPFVSLIDPADTRFVALGDMPQKIAAFCRETNQPAPTAPGAIIRCVLESLALLYRRTLVMLEILTGRKFTRLHIVGGGSKNELLNQFTANALGLPVLAGPAEATALGNVLVQAITLSDIASLAAGRELVARSFPLVRYEPQDRAAWDKAAERFQKIVGG